MLLFLAPPGFHQQDTKRAPYAYDAWAIGHILERLYLLCAPETPPSLGVLPPLGVRVYWGVILRRLRLGVRVYWAVLSRLGIFRGTGKPGCKFSFRRLLQLGGRNPQEGRSYIIVRSMLYTQ